MLLQTVAPDAAGNGLGEYVNEEKTSEEHDELLHDLVFGVLDEVELAIPFLVVRIRSAKAPHEAVIPRFWLLFLWSIT